MTKPRLRLFLRFLMPCLLAAAVVAIVLLTRHPRQYLSDQGSVWTTDYHVTYESDRWLGDSLLMVLRRVDVSASMYNDTSLLSRLNRNETAVVDDIFGRLYSCSRQVNDASGGAFDPTVLPLVNAWGFGFKSGDQPTQHDIDSLLQMVGINKTALEAGRLVKKDPRVTFDFSSIAKGLACDEVARMFQRNGSRNYLVEIGGEVVACGVNPSGAVWHVSVDMPVADSAAVGHESALVLAINGCAVATSGSYRKFREVQGRRVSHIVDPVTGTAAVSNLLSATVIAADCMTADAWATACMVMGEAKVKEVMAKRDELGVMTISTDSTGNYVVWSNARFADCVVSH